MQEHAPEKGSDKVTAASVEFWTLQTAKDRGFESTFGHVAVGRNEEGFIVKAEKLSDVIPHRFVTNPGYRSELDTRAQEIFGLSKAK